MMVMIVMMVVFIEIVVVDMGSTFGSKLNGAAVVRSALHQGDCIEIGHSTITLRAIDYTDDDLQALLHRSRAGHNGNNGSNGNSNSNKKCIIM
jgi:pSer/pThr/pTyr-binding forkhead associated (FHA) protein